MVNSLYNDTDCGLFIARLRVVRVQIDAEGSVDEVFRNVVICLDTPKYEFRMKSLCDTYRPKPPGAPACDQKEAKEPSEPSWHDADPALASWHGGWTGTSAF